MRPGRRRGPRARSTSLARLLGNLAWNLANGPFENDVPVR